LFRSDTPQKVVGRYALFSQIARGGMGTVHLGRLVASAGFERVVAIKRVHPELMLEHEFLGMFRDEIRIAARVQHPNVVSALDVVEDDRELWLVMEYVHGAPLAQLQKLMGGRGVSPPVVAAILVGVLQGLHAAHEAKSASGEPLGIVHRDVSPQNVLVGCDGVARVLDFGVAKAASQLQHTVIGQIKGKFSYLAPERLVGVEIDRRVDIYGAAVVAVEMLLGHRLFGGTEAEVLGKILNPQIPPLGEIPGVSPALESLLLKGLARNPEQRFQTAAEMAIAVHAAAELAPAHEVGAWVQATASNELRVRARCLADLEATPASELLELATPRPASVNAELATQLCGLSLPPGSAPRLLQPKVSRERWLLRALAVALGAGLLGFGWSKGHARNALGERSASVSPVQSALPAPAAAPAPASPNPVLVEDIPLAPVLTASTAAVPLAPPSHASRVPSAKLSTATTAALTAAPAAAPRPDLPPRRPRHDLSSDGF
jgi:serine/threonine-protein kinase